MNRCVFGNYHFQRNDQQTLFQYQPKNRDLIFSQKLVGKSNSLMSSHGVECTLSIKQKLCIRGNPIFTFIKVITSSS